MEQQQPFRSGFAALIGRPNSGKSTLMNTVVGEQLSIVTPLPQTTRKNLRGILTTAEMQLVFIDTPGIHKGKYSFNEMMINEAKGVFRERGIDVICYLVDLSREFGDEEKIVAEIVTGARVPVLLLFNKVDVCKNVEEKIKEFYELFPSLKDAPSLQCAAVVPETKDLFVKAITPFIHEGPKYYDDEDLTDANLRFFAAEFLRKQIILTTREEVPHATFIEIESYKETAERHQVIATIHVETTGQRGIIVGKQGTGIKKIRRDAEKEMKELVQVPVSITCHVKVTPKWRDNDNFLHTMGY